MAKFLHWLYLPDGHLPLISKLVGWLSLPIAIVVWFWSHAGQPGPYYPQPFSVPAWRIGDFLLDPPLPPEAANVAIFVLFAGAAVALIFGQRRRFLYIYMAMVLAYYTAHEWFVCCFFWVLLDFCFLVALSTSEPRATSPARRLIQLTLASCYIFSVLQKVFYSDFWQGISLEAFFYDGFAVTPIFKNLVVSHPLPEIFWRSASIFLLFGEAFIGVGLFFRRTRLIACALGVVLHGGIIIVMEPIIAIFSLEMWTGYLAFFEKKGLDSQSNQESSKLAVYPIKTLVALIALAMLILMPARIYYLPGPPNDLLTLFDRTPWTFGMFLMRQNVEAIEISYDDPSGAAHQIEPTGRIKTISNDNELIALAHYVRSQAPEATAIRINDQIIINERRRILKILIWDNPKSAGNAPKISVSAVGDYCRGAANKNPDSDRRP